MKPEYENLPYRPNVCMVTYREREGVKEFLLVSRSNWPEGYWKFPQGGIEEGEDLITAGKREFVEEIGTEKFEISGVSKIENKYDWEERTILERNCRFRGQFQRYVAIKFLGEESDIKIDTGELKDYQWVSKEEVVSFAKDPEHKLFKHYNGKMVQVINEFGL